MASTPDLGIGEILFTMALLAGTVLGAIWAAAKVFRTGILMYGKRPRFNEVVLGLRLLRPFDQFRVQVLDDRVCRSDAGVEGLLAVALDLERTLIPGDGVGSVLQLHGDEGELLIVQGIVELDAEQLGGFLIQVHRTGDLQRIGLRQMDLALRVGGRTP